MGYISTAAAGAWFVAVAAARIGLAPHKFVTLSVPFLVGAVAFVVGLIAIAYHVQGPDGEPFAVFDGVSIWPSEALQLLAGLLCLHFLFVAHYGTGENNEKIGKDFCLDALPENDRDGGFRRNLRLSLHAVRPGGDGGGGAKIVDPQKLWTAYLRRGRFRWRIARTLPAVVAYALLGWGVVAVFGLPTPPYRGQVSRWFDALTTFAFSLPLATFLTLYVVDSTLLNVAFISALAAGDTDWRFASMGECRKRWPGAADVAVKSYMDVRLVADRTRVVGRIVYYPFVILLLLSVSRVSYFDNWDWPPGLILVALLTASVAAACALTLRWAAEQTRRKVVDDLRKAWLAFGHAGDEKQASLIRDMMDEVKRERAGAFSLLSQYPVVAAVLLPSSGIGVWAVLEYLAKQ